MPEKTERQFVKDISDGDRVTGVYLCADASLSQARTGPYLRVKLQDRTGSIECRVWDDAERMATRFKSGDYVRIEGLANEYKGVVQLKLNAVDRVDDADVDPSMFLKATKCDVPWMWTRLREHVNAMQDPFLRELLNRLLDDEAFAVRFRQAPAAMGNHHAWLGGLLEHTLSLIYLMKRITPHYPQVNQDLCLVGAVMHDMGKVWEYSWDRKLDMTDSGRLVGHLVMAVGKVKEIASAIPGFPEPLMLECQHLIAAHHGQYEFGSPKLPQTLEAMVVHMADNLDSKVNQMSMALEGNPEVNGRWTDYQKQFQGPLYRGDRPRELPAGFVPLPVEKGGREGLSGEYVETASSPVAAVKPVDNNGGDGRGSAREKPAAKPAKTKTSGQEEAKDMPMVRDLFSSR